MDVIRIAGIEPESIVDGPGFRYTIFSQGCIHNCCECHNPETWDLDGGYAVPIKDILNQIFENPLLDGVTFSGGEPFLRATEFCIIAKACKERGLSVWVYTGFLYEDLLKSKYTKELLDYVDVLIDGQFDINKKTLRLKYVGSENQRIINVQKSLKADKVILLDDK